MQPIIIWGASGHALVVADAIRANKLYQVMGFLDDVNLDRYGLPFGGATILGGRSILHTLATTERPSVFIAIGDCQVRLALAREVQALGLPLATIIHPHASVASDVQLGSGCFVAAGAVINPQSRLGTAVIVNTGACVDHECELADGVHIGPGAHLGGRVSVAQAAWIGLGAAVRDRVSIGTEAMVGMGSVVVADVPPHVTVWGVPARIRRSDESL